MSKPIALRAGTIALLATAALLTGCSTSTPQQNEAQVCVATKAYASALTSFKDTLTPTATVDHVRTSLRDDAANIQGALSDLGTAAKC